MLLAVFVSPGTGLTSTRKLIFSPKGSVGKSRNVTVRVSHEESARLAFSSENGKVWIVLRPRTGAKPTPPDIVTLETVLFGVPPVAAARSFGGSR